MNDRDFFRHTLATLGYRAGRTFRELPDSFSSVRMAEGSRSAGEILAHICDLLDWALIMAREKHVWHDTAPQAWHADIARFQTALAALDAYVISGAPLQAPFDKLFQGPIADALTHVGQIALLRRLADAQVKGENFFRAEIQAP